MNATKLIDLADTAELVALETTEPGRPGSIRVRADCGALSHRGMVRRNNEDHYLVARFGRFLSPLLTNITGHALTMLDEEGHAMVVADGLGGASAGEVASELAIRSLLKLVFETPDWIISRDAQAAERVMKRMAERYRQIDDVLLEKAQTEAHLKGMGTTMTLACSVSDSLILTHVGDSRAYLFRANTLHQLTHDHTLAQALVDQGALRHINEASSQFQHTLVRLLGGGGRQCEADVQHVALQDDDVLVLCSDGLSDMVKDADITAILKERKPAAQTCDALVAAALKNGGRDNVTVIVVRYAFYTEPVS